MATGRRRELKVRDKSLPGPFKLFVERFPALGDMHEHVTETVESVGPLNRKTNELIKIGICVGAGLESALRSHVRRALKAGASKREIEQAIALGMTTVGFPRTVAAWCWAQVQFDRDRGEKPAPSARRIQ